jgi:tRNA (cmo5U34)-methyltransferase
VIKIPKSWTFETENVAKGFDQHVRGQLPWYDLATFAVVHLAKQFLYEGSTAYELGASTGNIGRALKETIDDRKIKYIAVEKSEEMAKIYDAKNTQLIISDIRDFKFFPCDTVISFLVLMFIPPADRRGLLSNIWSSIRPGGALLIVDKAEPIGGYLGTASLRLTFAAKHATGTLAEDILSKEVSLSGIQIPYDFFNIESAETMDFFRFGDFRGVVYRKPV